MKRIFAFLFASLLASQAWAYDFQSGDLYYNITGDNTVEVTCQAFDNSGNYPDLTSVEIPETVSHNSITYTVTCIGVDAFFCAYNLTSVTIPNNVTSIGRDAFRGCNNLTSINIPNSVEIIVDQAFAGCENLTSITIPNGVKTIGRSAFIDCNGLTSVTIPSSVSSIGSSPFGRCNNLTEINVESGNTNYTSDNGVLFDKDMTTIICYPTGKTQTKYDIPESVKTIGEDAFIGCNNLTTATIPDGVIDISEYAFQSCKSLESISIPGSVKSIGYGAFAYCSNLKSVTMSEGLETIDRIAFGYCSSLISVTIPSSVTSVGSGAFQNVNNVVNLSNNVTAPDGNWWGANSCTSGKDFVLSEDGKTLKNYNGEDGVVYIPSTVTSIGDDAFSGHTEITSVYIPNSVESIGERAFQYCDVLETVTIPESVKTIGDKAFAGCNGLTSIEIPESVTNLASTAFESCDNLTDIYYAEDGIRYHILNDNEVEVAPLWDNGGSSYSGNVVIPESISIGGNTYKVTTIGGSAFIDCNGLTSVTIPSSVSSIGSSPFGGCDKLTGINVDPNNTKYESENGVLFNKGKTELICYPAGKTETTYSIPESVKTVGKNAFYDCQNLKSVTLGKSVETIGDWAFYGFSGLTAVTIPNSVTSIGEGAFYGCSGLTALTIPNSVTSIGNAAFYKCSGLTVVTIPESVKTVGEYAFAYCSNLSKVTYNPATTTIGEDAFLGTNVNLGGNGEEVALTYDIHDGAAVVTGYKDTISGRVIIPASVTINGTEYLVTSIAANAFSGCQTIESVIISDGVENIGECAFYNCHSIREVIIGKSVETIGNKAFRGCHKLRSVEVPSQVSSVGEDAFFYVKNVDYYGGADGAPWSALTLNGTKDGDFIYSDAEKTKLTAYIGDGGFAVIPKGVTSIGYMSFFESDNLESVSIPNTVTSIGGSAFANCYSMKTVNVPLSVRTIGRGAFRDCAEAIIYCEANSQPTSWHFEWDYKANKILWGQSNAPVAINDEPATGVVIYAVGRTIVVENATDEILVYNVMGTLVCRDVARNVSTVAKSGVRTELQVNGTGVYIVKVGNIAKRVMVND